MIFYKEYIVNPPLNRIRIMEEDGFITGVSLAGTPGTDHFLRKGERTFEEEGERLRRETASNQRDMNIHNSVICQETPLIQETFRQLQEYLQGQRRQFTLPLQPKGTRFQQSVWEQLQQIPYGELSTYGRIASNLGKPGASRAIGMANHCNPIAIIIPCHRVIGADHSLTGYGGGLDIKEFLLQLEDSYR